MELTAMTDTDLDALRIQVLTEQERRRTLANAQQQAEQIAAQYAAAVAGQAPAAYRQPTGAHDAYGPGALILWEGATMRNRSGGWLSNSPAEYPRGWEVTKTADPNPTPPAAPAWSATADYKIGDKATRGGVTYRCLVAHGAAYGGTWGPPLASVWAIVP